MFNHVRAFQLDVLVTFAERLRFVDRLSVTLPTRAVPLCGGHSFRRQMWKKFTSARSRPTVPSFCIHASGRQVALKLPSMRWMSLSFVYCMMSPGDHCR